MGEQHKIVQKLRVMGSRALSTPRPEDMGEGQPVPWKEGESVIQVTLIGVIFPLGISRPDATLQGGNQLP